MKKNIMSKRLVIFAAIAFLFLGAVSIINAEGTLLYEQEWYDGGTAATTAVDNANDVDYEAADNFYNLSSSIDTVVIYGLTLFHDGSDWVEMTPDATEPFIVRFYADNGSDPGIEATTTGTYNICLEDSYGDGWNGGVVSVFVDGTLVLEEITLDSGSGPECHNFTANAGEYITTVYVADEYPGENYYCIKDPSDTIIAEEGVGDDTPSSIGGPNEPDWDSPISEQSLTANVTYITDVWSGSYSLYSFNMTLDEVMDLEDGWISAQIDADNGSGTWFLWLNSLDGDLTSYQRVPEDYFGFDNTKIVESRGVLGYDFGLELWDIFPDGPELPEITELTLDYNNTFDPTWYDVSGDLENGFSLALNSSINYYYLDTDTVTTNMDLETGYYGFYVNPSEQNFTYWANKGVYEGCSGSWEPYMWDIINGSSPIFYLKVGSGQNFMLVDGLQYQIGQGDQPLRVNGDYPLGTYHYNGTVTGIDGNESDPIIVEMTFTDVNEVVDISQDIFDRGFPIRHAVDGDWSGAQNFTPTLTTISKAEIYTRAFGSPDFDLTVELRENDPEGTLLDTVVFAASDVPSSWTWLEVDFADVTVGSGTDYFIVCPPAPSGVTTSFGYEWGYAFGDQYPDGSFWFTRDGGDLWRDLPTMYEFAFKTYGY